MPLKRDTKKTPFCMYSNKLFLKDGIQDNHWVGHLVMRLVNDVAFQKRNALREDNNDKSDNIEMCILDEGAIDKIPKGLETL